MKSSIVSHQSESLLSKLNILPLQALILFEILSILQLSYPSPLFSHPREDTHNKCIATQDYYNCVRLHSHIKPPRSYGFSRNYWLEFGTIMINWTAWVHNSGSYIAPAINSQGKNIYIAINCTKEVINTTGEALDWKGWLSPSLPFEEELISDFCTDSRTYIQ